MSQSGSLLAFLATIPDPRDRSGRRHPLVAMLAHACCAILCGCRGYAAIAKWGRDQPIELMHRLGYRRRPPAYGTFQGLFTRLDAQAFEAAIARWIDRLLGPATAGAPRAVAIDGKVCRGSGTAAAPAVHLLAALDQQTGCVLAQARVPAATNEHKAALGLLKALVLEGGPRPPAEAIDQAWTLDFLEDATVFGRKFRILAVPDVYTRECLAIRAEARFSSARVAEMLQGIAFLRGVPSSLWTDNGPEFTGEMLDLWAYLNGVVLDYSRPGQPTDNAFIESFNGRLREECLNGQYFADLEDARRVLEAWRIDYNTMRTVLTVPWDTWRPRNLPNRRPVERAQAAGKLSLAWPKVGEYPRDD